MTQTNLDEVVTLKGDIEKQTLLSANLRIALQGEKAKVALLERERDATLVVLQNRERELERMRTAVETEQQNLKSENIKLADQLSMVWRELDDSKSKMESQKTALKQSVADRRELTEKLSTARFYGSLLQSFMNKALDSYVQLELPVMEFESDKTESADRLSIMQKEVDDAKNKMKSQKTTLEQSIVDRGKPDEAFVITPKDVSEKMEETQDDNQRLEHSMPGSLRITQLRWFR